GSQGNVDGFELVLEAAPSRGDGGHAVEGEIERLSGRQVARHRLPRGTKCVLDEGIAVGRLLARRVGSPGDGKQLAAVAAGVLPGGLAARSTAGPGTEVRGDGADVEVEVDRRCRRILGR